MQLNELTITLAASTDKGMVREKNEDAFLVMTIRPKDRGPHDIRAVLLVADGMGGHVGGEKASSSAVRYVIETFRPKGRVPTLRFGTTVPEAVVDIIREANRRVTDLGEGSPKPPGTTFTGVFVVEDRAYIGHIGDSRAYHIRNDEIVPVTEDHSYVGKLLKEGKLTAEEAKTFPQKNILLKSLGAGELDEIDAPGEVVLRDGDVLVLCSDGLWDLVSDQEILGVVHGERNLKKACDRLIEIANMRGGHDNITVVAAEFGRLQRDRALARSVDDIRAPAPQRGPSDRRIRALLQGGLVFLSVSFLVIVGIIIMKIRDHEGTPGGGGYTPTPSVVAPLDGPTGGESPLPGTGGLPAKPEPVKPPPVGTGKPQIGGPPAGKGIVDK